jgi:hypothetical protein
VNVVIYSHSLTIQIGRKAEDSKMENTHNQQEGTLTLWIITASSSKKHEPLLNSPDFVTAIYAYDQEDAEKKALSWFVQHPERPYHYFMECPEGFTMGIQAWIPGRIQEAK